MQFLLRNLALIGALLLVVAEARAEGRSLFAGVPSLGENKPKTYLQLAGRILLAFMFITLLRFEYSFLQVSRKMFKNGYCKAKSYVTLFSEKEGRCLEGLTTLHYEQLLL